MARPCSRAFRAAVVRSLFYPQGFESKDDGGLGLTASGHLYQGETLGEDGCQADSDQELEEGWLKGRTHPITGAPL